MGYTIRSVNTSPVKTLTDSGIYSIEYVAQPNIEANFMYGCGAASCITVRAVYDANAFTDGQEVNVSYAEVVNGSTVTTTIGRFIVREPKKTSDSEYEFTAYDVISKLDVSVADYLRTWLEASPAYTKTVSVIASDLATLCGVTITISNGVNTSMTVNAFYADNLTARDIINMICQVTCTTARLNGSAVYLMRYIDGGQSITPSGANNTIPYFANSLVVADYQTELIQRVQIHTGSDSGDVGVIFPPDATGETYEISNNMLFGGKNASEISVAAYNIYDMVGAIQYTPIKFKVPRTHRINDFQKLTLTDKNNNAYTVYPMKITTDASGTTVECTGNKSRGSAAVVAQKKFTNLTGKTLSMTADIDAVRTEMTDLSEDVSTLAEQTADKFSWLISSGTSSTDFTLTPRTASLVTGTLSLEATEPDMEVTITPTASGATYGFTLGSDGYYKSTNEGVNSSYSMCLVTVETSSDDILKLECINYGELNYDYGLIGKLDVTLANGVDDATSNIFYKFTANSSDPVEISIPVTAGTHTFNIKYRKNSSSHTSPDCFKFKVKSERQPTTLALKAGSATISSADIYFNGAVTFADLENSGQTIINGDNIKTGSIEGVNFVARRFLGRSGANVDWYRDVEMLSEDNDNGGRINFQQKLYNSDGTLYSESILGSIYADYSAGTFGQLFIKSGYYNSSGTNFPIPLKLVSTTNMSINCANDAKLYIGADANKEEVIFNALHTTPLKDTTTRRSTTMRAAPTSSATALATITSGTSIELIRCIRRSSVRWAEIIYNNQVGWVQVDYSSTSLWYYVNQPD